eukprot:m.1355056 g.1355056  ORF g.1355056 m.1355056 type:complete len:700 (-) comp24932_c0_seq37:2552-4651(-)
MKPSKQSNGEFGENFDLGLDDLNITSDDYSFEDVDGHIQANLEDEIVKEALDKGLDLRVYSRQIEDQLRSVEQSSVADYIKESKKMADLHVQIQSCDAILERMEEMLGLFQSDLGNISGEIQTLQDQSLSMNIKLKNRKAVQASLGDFVGGMSISSDLVETVCNGSVNERYVDALDELDKKLTYVSGQADSTASTVAVSSELEALTLKATSKIREFVLQKIYAMRKPMSNIQMQQNSLLKFKDAFRFLAKHNKAIAIEIRNEYVDTFSKIHYTYFKQYLTRLMKLQHEEMADKDDLMGADDSPKGRTNFFSSRPSLKSRTSVFTLGNRSAILQDLEGPILVPHTLKDAGKDVRHPYEMLFRSLQFALLDTSAREFLFCIEFFKIKEGSALKFFTEVMGKTLHLILKHEEARLANWYDSISVVLCSRILGEYQKTLRERNMPCLDTFYQRLFDLFWPRFKVIVEMNRVSIEGLDPQKLSHMDTRPHYIVRRYAEYSGALLLLNEGVAFEDVTNGLSSLRQEVANFILRMAAEFARRREQLIFLINNYDMMLSVYSERTTAKSEEVAQFDALLQKSIQEFAQEELAAPFGGLINFVREVEQTKSRKQTVTVDEHRVNTLNFNFARDWKPAITEIEGNIMKSFTNFKNGTAILQAALTQLVVYYERYIAILKSPPFKRPGGWPDLIDRHHVMVEVKKHKTTF